MERLPPLGALPLTRHLFPIPLQATCSPSGPPENTVFSLWVMFGRSPSSPCCAHIAKPRQCPGCAGQSSPRTPWCTAESTDLVSTPHSSSQTAARGGGKEKNKPCVVLNVDQKKSGVQIRVGKIANPNLLVQGNCSWLKHYCIPDILL